MPNGNTFRDEIKTIKYHHPGDECVNGDSEDADRCSYILLILFSRIVCHKLIMKLGFKNSLRIIIYCNF